MSTRLYYHDSYLIAFQSTRIAQTTLNGSPAIRLAESAFYPTSGGQPYDHGTLNDIPVLEVIADDEGHVWHITETPIEAKSIHGLVLWERRFDHMQHHTGQHILTRAFIEVANAETIGFHLSESTVTIDLNRVDLREQDFATAESLANQIIYENRAVKAWFPDTDTLASLNLRKISDKVQGAIRVVDIGGFDVTACGGTHVAYTGEIGIIKIIKIDKRGDLTRVEFLCGKRALLDYQEKTALLNRVAAQMTTAYQQIPDILEKMREENKMLSRELKEARQTLLMYESEALWQAASGGDSSSRKVIIQVFEDRSAADLQALASLLVVHPQTMVCLGIAGEKSHILLARSEDVTVDVVPLLKNALVPLNGRGGGRPTMAQGGGGAATRDQLITIFSQLQDALGD